MGVMLTAAMGFVGCSMGAGRMINTAELAPKYSSILYGISNSCGALAGIFAPLVAGILTTNVRVPIVNRLKQTVTS